MVLPIAAPPRKVGLWKSRVGLSPAGTGSLVAVAAVLVFVSLARLHPLMTHENEVDARQTVALLAAQLPAWNEQEGHRSLIPSLEQLAEADAVRQALSDGVFEEDGRLLKRHGYLFCVVELPPPPFPRPAPGTVLAATAPRASPEPLLGVLAWPWKHGSSGRPALISTAEGRLYRHANTPALWSGPESVHEVPADWSGWREL